MTNLLTAGNGTMPSSVGIFNLPSLVTCTPSKWCRDHCYTLKNRYLWPQIKKAYAWRYQQSKNKSFVKKMISEISRRKSLKHIRVHISGDFYNLSYIEKWAEIAKAFPERIFRTNTRRQDLLLLMIDKFPSNFVIRESTDNTRKSTGLVPQAAIHGTKGSERFFTCINDCEKCKFHCWHNSKINVVTERIL